MKSKVAIYAAVPILLFCSFFFILPFFLLRLYGFELNELPFMFILLVGMTKLFTLKAQTDQGIKRKAFKPLGKNYGKQQTVDAVRAYKFGQDAAFVTSAIAIFILNIILA